MVPVSAGEIADAPQLLPGGKAILFSIKKLTDSWDKGQIVVQSLSGDTRKTVVDGGAAALYVPTGHLVYAVASVLFAVPFDLDSQVVSGGAVSIVEGVDRGFVGIGPGRSATAHYTFSSTGSLMFVPEANIWLAELAGTSVLRRLTFGGKNRAPVWSGDSQWVAFQSDRDGDAGIFRQRADGSGTAERLTTAETAAAHIPQSSSPDGAHLLFTVFKDGQYSLWDLLLKDRRASPFADVRAQVLVEAAFSPDGRWVVYQAGDAAVGTIRPAVQQSYVQPFPATGAKYQVPARTGGGHPVWSSAGDAILTSTAINRDTATPVITTPRFVFGRPDEYPHGARLNGNPSFTRRNWDPVPDGRILGVLSVGSAQSDTVDQPQVSVVLNWFDELRQRVK